MMVHINRESVFTQLARIINDFSDHKLNKVELYNETVRLLEIVSQEEKEDRSKYELFLEDLLPGPKGKIFKSNWAKGLKIIEGR